MHCLFTGSKETWHGELDLLTSGGVSLAVTEKLEADAEEENTRYEQASDDTDLSPKQQLQRSFSNGNRAKRKEIEGVMGQSIVFGFTEYNRHPELTPYIPTILIDSNVFWTLIYDPVDDCLIAGNKVTAFVRSDPIFRYHKSDRFQGLFLLWVLLNYRLFFRKDLDGSLMPFESLGFKETARRTGNLCKYEALCEFYEEVVGSKYKIYPETVMNRPIKKRKIDLES